MGTADRIEVTPVIRRRLAWLSLGAEVLCFGGLALAGGSLGLDLKPDPETVDMAVSLANRGTGPLTGLLAAITLLGVGNLLWAVVLGLSREGPLLRRLGFWGRLSVSLCQLCFLVVLGLSLLAGAMAFTALLGPLGFWGVGFFGVLALGWLWFVGLGPSACLIAFLWNRVREGAMPPLKAALGTLLLLIPVVDIAAAVTIYIGTSPENGTRRRTENEKR
ncbi:MAG: hypothetical protein HFF11_01880 [Angelakisella sp.]|nr:hypothetical protein [Angelakisella sp.]